MAQAVMEIEHQCQVMAIIRMVLIGIHTDVALNIPIILIIPGLAEVVDGRCGPIEHEKHVAVQNLAIYVQVTEAHDLIGPLQIDQRRVRFPIQELQTF